MFQTSESVNLQRDEAMVRLEVNLVTLRYL